jgi:hypothetical protein
MLSRRQSNKSDKAKKSREAVERLEFERARESFLVLVNAAAERAAEQ